MIRPELDTRIYYVNFPPGINEAVMPNLDGTYTVYIDENLSQQKRIAAYQHAVEHILNNDCEKQCNVNLIEFYAHSKE